jgi:hypothetical protein
MRSTWDTGAVAAVELVELLALFDDEHPTVSNVTARRRLPMTEAWRADIYESFRKARRKN